MGDVGDVAGADVGVDAHGPGDGRNHQGSAAGGEQKAAAVSVHGRLPVDAAPKHSRANPG